MTLFYMVQYSYICNITTCVSISYIPRTSTKCSNVLLTTICVVRFHLSVLHIAFIHSICVYSLVYFILTVFAVITQAVFRNLILIFHPFKR